MMPWQAAKKWQLENSLIPFEEVLAAYMNGGLVHSTPEVFVLARETLWEDGQMYAGGGVKPNCWFCQLSAGDKPFQRLLKLAPRKRKYVAWQRRGQPRYHVWEWKKFAKKIKEK